MKKNTAFIIVVITAAALVGCSSPLLVNREGVAPYKLTASELELLQSLGLDNDVNLISFKAPQSARSLAVGVYILGDDGNWITSGGGRVLLGDDDTDRLEGTLAVIFREDYALEFHISTKGRASYTTNKLDLDLEMLLSSRSFLSDYREIELNQEIPVAVMAYTSGTSLRAFGVDNFFTPEVFAGADLVQAVTLTFTE